MEPGKIERKVTNAEYMMELGKLGHYLTELAAVESDVHATESKLVKLKARQRELIDTMGPAYYECRDVIFRTMGLK